MKSVLILGAGDRPTVQSLRGIPELPNELSILTTDIRPLPKIDFVVDLNSPFEAWGLAEGSFDYVIAEHIIEHLNDRIAFLRGCRRLLKDDGTLILEVPNYKHIGAVGDLEHKWLFCRQSFYYRSNALNGQFLKADRIEYYFLFLRWQIIIKWELLGRWLDRATHMIAALRFYLRKG